MANIFEGANKLKNEAEEVEKVLEKLKLTSARLEKIEKTFSEVENISPDLEKITKEIVKLKEEYDKVDISFLKNSINNHIKNLFKKQKIWLLYIPFTMIFISFIATTYIYFKSIKELKSQNENLVKRLDSIYNMHLLDKKYWYDKKNQEIFLKDYDWIEKRMKEEKNQK